MTNPMSQPILFLAFANDRLDREHCVRNLAEWEQHP